MLRLITARFSMGKSLNQHEKSPFAVGEIPLNQHNSKLVNPGSMTSICWENRWKNPPPAPVPGLQHGRKIPPPTSGNQRCLAEKSPIKCHVLRWFSQRTKPPFIGDSPLPRLITRGYKACNIGNLGGIEDLGLTWANKNRTTSHGNWSVRKNEQNQEQEILWFCACVWPLTPMPTSKSYHQNFKHPSHPSHHISVF